MRTPRKVAVIAVPVPEELYAIRFGAAEPVFFMPAEIEGIYEGYRKARKARPSYETRLVPVTPAPVAMGALDVPPQTAPVSETGPAAFCGLVGDGDE